jgi:putative CocE/NonD family hydrolase
MNGPRHHAIRVCAVLPLTAILMVQLLPGQGFDYIRDHYFKHEYQIAMRDGAKLFTAVYTPKDRSKSYPILLIRTPYGISPYGKDVYPDSLGPSERFAKEGFIFALQDVRGRMMSEGEFVNMRPQKSMKNGPREIDESTDTHDTIDWLVRNIPHHNGRVGMWGISYPGFYAAAGLIDAHPALIAASPQAPIADWFIGDDFHHNGAFWLRPSAAETNDGVEPQIRARHARWLQFFPEAGTIVERKRNVLQTRNSFLGRSDGPRHLRFLLAG